MMSRPAYLWMTTPNTIRSAIAATALAGFITPARAQLQPDQVLVVYDSNIQGSREVAEYYAGSAKVPGGEGGLPGIRPGVRVFNLASVTTAPCLPATQPPCLPVADIDFAQFQSRYRTPIRTFLNSNNIARRVRCIVLTKGLPHRLQDSDNAAVGDNPGGAGTEFNAGDATYASVDAELAFLWINVETGEAGGTGDSARDGVIINPFWRSGQPMTSWRTIYQQLGKPLGVASGFGAGQGWVGSTGSLTISLTPGDMYMVCRLDGVTVADVRASIDRAQSIAFNDSTDAIILDEGAGDGTQSVSFTGDNEFDNDGPTSVSQGDDYEQTRDALIADRRWLPANIRYDFGPGPSAFIVGPRLVFADGIVVTAPIAHLATLGQNHIGGEAPSAGNRYAESFNYINGAIFNSIESYNGRRFGNLDAGSTGQEQLSEFIGAGGTLGIGNVYEPFSFSAADNLFIAQNFWLGNLTWAEAAYSSLPVVSWQQIVVGDPLARVRRTREDLNGDNLVNIDDLYAFHESPAPPDLNRDGTANNADYLLLERSVRQFDAVNMNTTASGKHLD